MGRRKDSEKTEGLNVLVTVGTDGIHPLIISGE